MFSNLTHEASNRKNLGCGVRKFPCRGQATRNEQLELFGQSNLTQFQSYVGCRATDCYIS